MASAITQPTSEADVASSSHDIGLKEVSAVPITQAIPKDILTACLTNAPFIPLDGALNLRDIGLLPNSPIKPGVLYRSGSLQNIPPEKLPSLHSHHGIKAVYDLRHTAERSSNPEPEIEGIEMVWCQTPTPPRRDDPSVFEADGGIPGFVSMYRDLLKLYGPQYKRILERLRDRPGEAVLWHCTAGKDRAGLFGMMILSLCGAGRELIGYDYSLSRIGVERDREVLEKNLEKWLGKDAMKMPGMINLGNTKPEIAYAVLDAVEEDYGGFWKFCESELGMSNEDLELIVKNIKA